MPCYHPIAMYRDARGNICPSYKLADSDFRVPCGRCIGCRLERSRQWAQRLVDELRFHDRSSFITLTYAPEFLPPGGSLVLRDWQLFFKKLRKQVFPERLRFFHAGEYGEKFKRPHYHAIIFGEDFLDDRYDLSKSDRGDLTWSSPLLDKCWGKGRAVVGSVTFESCAYVARYITKKWFGPSAEDHYWRYDQKTGECYDLTPEYATMSRRRGIGYAHMEAFHDEIFYRDSVYCRGVEMKPPRYYDKVLEKLSPMHYHEMKGDRQSALSFNPAKHRPTLKTREAVKLAQVSTFLTRRYEYGEE